MDVPPKTLADQVAAASPQVTPEIERLKLGTIPAVSFRFRDVEPPSQVYIGPNDFLRVNVIASNSTSRAVLRGRLLLVTGKVQDFEYRFAVTPTGTQNVQVFPVAEGYLLSLRAFNESSGIQRGQIFLTVGLQFGPSSTSGVPYAVLFQDFIDDLSIIGWPGGRMVDTVEGPGAIVTQTLANPGPGANFTFTVPAFQRWRPRTLTVKLATAVAAGTRDMAIQFTDGTNILFTLAPSVTQAPSLTVTYSFGLNLGAEVSDAAQGFVAEPLPDVLLEPASTVVSVVQNIQGADQLSLIAMQTEVWQSA